MKFHEDHAIQEIKRVEVVCCDRCGAKAPLDYSDVSKWFEAEAHLLGDPTAWSNVTYHLCPSCRGDLALFMAGPSQAVYEDERYDALVARLADILYPMDEYADTQWNGADVCDMLAAVLDDVAPWARRRQPAGPDDAFEAYRAERERLGL